MSWDLKLYHLPQSFIQRSLESVCTRFLKKWLRLPQCANPKGLYFEPAKGGLGLPSITPFPSSLTGGKWIRLTHSHDQVVSSRAVKSVKHQADLNSQAAGSVLDVWTDNTDLSVAQLKQTALKTIRSADNQECLESVCQLEVQGRFARTLNAKHNLSGDYWSRVVWSLPARHELHGEQCARHTATQFKSCQVAETSEAIMPSLWRHADPKRP